MRLARPLAIAVTVILVAFAVLEFIAVAQGAARRGELGWDYSMNMKSATHWLTTGQLYFPGQYVDWTNAGEVNLYPPLALYLFVPMSFLPAVLYWAIPLGALTWAIVAHRPPWWTWPLMAGVACLLPFSSMVVYGNSGMWTLAAVAVGSRFAMVGPLVALKPTELIWTLTKIRTRGWWVGIGSVALLALPLLPLWFEWLEVMSHYSGATITYSMNAAPMYLTLWLVAWLGGASTIRRWGHVRP